MTNLNKLLTENKKRFYCETCGRKLKKPETDFRNLAICNKCLKGQK